MNPKTPTDELWSSYQVLFNWFNKQLFKDLLTPCVLNFSTKATVYGFFAANRWQKEQGITAHADQIGHVPRYPARLYLRGSSEAGARE